MNNSTVNYPSMECFFPNRYGSMVNDLFDQIKHIAFCWMAMEKLEKLYTNNRINDDLEYYQSSNTICIRSKRYDFIIRKIHFKVHQDDPPINVVNNNALTINKAGAIIEQLNRLIQQLRLQHDKYADATTVLAYLIYENGMQNSYNVYEEMVKKMIEGIRKELKYLISKREQLFLEELFNIELINQN